MLKYKDIEEQGDKIVKALRLQMKAYPEELFGVLCPRHEELRVIWEIISQSKLADVAVFQSSEDGYVPFAEDTRICVCTLHSAKGLEFRALHIAGMEYVKRFAKQRDLCYTGVTRAKTSLSVYYNKDLPGYLEGAYAAITPPPDPPKLTELFKKEVE